MNANNQIRPPRWAEQLLESFCPPETLEEVQGDLAELYAYWIQTQGKRAADRRYVFSALRLLRPFSKRKKSSYSYSSTTSLPLDMLNNYFLVAWRNLQLNVSSAFINIIGLVVGLACFLLISLYLIDEVSYDTFHPQAHQTYRISYLSIREDGKQEPQARSGGNWSIALKEAFPEVEQITRFSRFGYPGFMKYDEQDKVFLEPEVLFVDSTYSDIFYLPLLKGDALQALRSHQSVVITTKMASKYFGKEDPIGKTIVYHRQDLDMPLVVTAVMEEYPSNAHFRPDFLVNNGVLQGLWKKHNGYDRVNHWFDTFTYSYIKLRSGTDLDKIQTGLADLLKMHQGEAARFFKPILIPLTHIHFTPGMLYELSPTGNQLFIYIFSTIALLILLLACINYMNLTTARSIKRSKEVGLRKTMGSSRSALMLQFFSEAFLMTTICLLLAIGVVTLVLPLFNQLADKSFTFSSLWQFHILALLTCVLLIVTFIAGSYPSIYLSGFNPVETLKGKLSIGKSPERFRQTLVVLQFTITIVLIICTAFVYRQLGFINQSALNSKADQILSVRFGGIASMDKYPQYKQALLSNSFVKGVTMGSHLPRRENFSDIRAPFTLPILTSNSYQWPVFNVDFDFTTLFDLTLVAGRNFSPAFPTDSSAIILNEKAVKELGISNQAALGVMIESPGMGIKGQVIGIVKDFHFESMHKDIGPLAIRAPFQESEIVYIKLSTKDLTRHLSTLEKQWQQIYPGLPFEHWFLEEEFDRMYESEQKMSKIFNYFSLVAILIACLGIYGLATYIAERRIREIGIRKVLGASAPQIVVLLIKSFAKLVFLSFLIASPIAFYATHRWLETFVYRVEITPWIFVLAGGTVLLTALLTVGIQSFKAAISNPIEAIKHE